MSIDVVALAPSHPAVAAAISRLVKYAKLQHKMLTVIVDLGESPLEATRVCSWAKTIAGGSLLIFTDNLRGIASIPDHLFVWDTGTGRWGETADRLRKWLQATHTAGETVREITPPAILRELVADDDDEWREMFGQAARHDAYKARMDAALAKSKTSMLAFRYLLHLLTADRPTEHDPRPAITTAPKEKIERAFDLSLSLDSRDLAPNGMQNTILLIDDSDDAMKKVKNVANALLPGWQVESILRVDEFVPSFRSYSTASGLSVPINDWIAQLARTRFVLVDQLFGAHQAMLLGPELIRGLSRFLRDYDVRLRPTVTGREWIPPEIIAFSRTSDPDQIQQALRAGARDYVLKTQILRLRSVLSKVALGTSESQVHFHRNLRKLYDLPNEVIGLLQSARIPRQPYHHSSAPGDGKEKNERLASWRTLIAALPKTDLHVHVGSCMSEPFLIIASMFGLAVHPKQPDTIRHMYELFTTLRQNRPVGLPLDVRLHAGPVGSLSITGGKNWMREVATSLPRIIARGLSGDRSAVGRIRALVHSAFGIRDHVSSRELLHQIRQRSYVERAFFAVRFSPWADNERVLEPASYDDALRTYILTVAADDGWTIDGEEPFAWLTKHCRELHESYVQSAADGGNSWPNIPQLQRSRSGSELNSVLATGLKAGNLLEYLEGCEFAGALHLIHPYLMRLYAQQAIVRFLDSGTFYAELRGSPDGYVNTTIDFGFERACSAFRQAFHETQRQVVNWFREKGIDQTGWMAGVLGQEFEAPGIAMRYFRPHALVDRRLPPKVNLIFVGKRHKSKRQMILEAAASAVLRPPLSQPVYTSREFVEKRLERCDVIGFDLAGKESENPPSLFAAEFRRLSKLHIPLTVHAGENASSKFIEEAILELGARRIGHGLSLAEDKMLMARVRENRIGVELCPVSNHQTSHFTDPDEPCATTMDIRQWLASGRRYPLREYLDEGLLISLNTDNPVISSTDLVREYFQASWAYGEPGISLWEALRIIRMGYVQSFLALPERRAILEVVEQTIFDFFSSTEVTEMLRYLARSNYTKTVAPPADPDTPVKEPRRGASKAATRPRKRAGGSSSTPG